jgi:hypothetical protein
MAATSAAWALFGRGLRLAVRDDIELVTQHSLKHPLANLAGVQLARKTDLCAAGIFGGTEGMPLAPPVMNAVLPRRSFMVVSP